MAAAGETVPTSGPIPTKARRDFAEELYQACVSGQRTAKEAFSSLHSTWFLTVQAVIEYTDIKFVSKEQWVGGLAGAMLCNSIEWVPGSHRSKLTHRRVVMLVGVAPSRSALAARPGSLKRAAIEAEQRSASAGKKRKIDFGYPIPFITIPAIIENGFTKQEKQFKRGNLKILEHYQVARNCLVQCLGDPLCDLMLMMVLTICASSVTPCVAPNTRGFGKGAQKGAQKDAELLAANLVTRMLWFLKPRVFPWKEDDGTVLRIPEMTKKIGKSTL